MSTLLKLKKINLQYKTGKDNISVLKNIDLNIQKKETGLSPIKEQKLQTDN